MHFHRLFLAALACVVALAAAPARAQTLVMDYDGAAYGIVTFGHARVTATVTGDRYDARGSLDTAGLAVLFAKARARAVATGAFAPADARPDLYTLDHTYKDARRLWRVDWTRPVVEYLTSPSHPFVSEVPSTEAHRREGRDPLSTILAMGRRVGSTGRCDGVFRVFDGLYVYDLTMRARGAGRYRRNGIDWPVIRCAMTQRRIAGYHYRTDLTKELPDAEVWFATPPGAPFAILARFSSSLPLGAATISLTRYSAE